MKNNDNISTCAQADNKPVSMRLLVNTALNAFGVMFFVSFLGYIALHCF